MTARENSCRSDQLNDLLMLPCRTCPHSPEAEPLCRPDIGPEVRIDLILDSGLWLRPPKM